MPPVRIALCITELDAGGAERCLTELAIRMDRRRFEPVVYCLADHPQCAVKGDSPIFDDHRCAEVPAKIGTVPPERPGATFLPVLLDAGVEVHCLGGRGIWQFPMVLHRLKRLLSEQRPQIIQTFLFHANILGRIAARRAGIEHVVSGIRVAEHAAGWHLRLDRLTQKWVDHYICVSRAVADFSATRAKLPREKLVVIPNGIDLEKYPSPQSADLQQFGIAAGQPVVLFVGRLDIQKGVKWLVETAPQWLRRTPGCHLLLVGEGPLRGSLETTAKILKIADRVHFAGWRADVPALLAASKLFVLPSVWEGMPNAVLEAMAACRPVVATDVEGVLELLGPGAPEQTVHHGDTLALVERIVVFLQDSAHSTAVGAANRRRVEENFSISQVVRAYEEFWESLIKQSVILA
jgi:glycosyltransferase involved in cell wall biosynthesis